MKQKVSISIDDEVLERIRNKLKDGLFRNQSHLIEFATKQFLNDNEVN